MAIYDKNRIHLMAPPLSTTTAASKNRASKSRRKRGRRRFERTLFFVQVLWALSLISVSLPEAWGFAATNNKAVAKTNVPSMNNLSPMEDLLLRSRLETIKSGIKRKYAQEINSMGTENEATTPLSFIFPGAGGVDDLVLELQATISNSKIIDWKDHRGSFLTASYDSEAVGEAVAEIILPHLGNIKPETNALPPSSTGLRFIGISVGAFAANAAATIVHRHFAEHPQESNHDANEGHRTPPCVDLVLLDPFCGRGVLGPNYGRDNFGKHASTAIQILNTDDPVPTTNVPLPLCYCLDVTDAPEKRDFVLLPGDSMHSWPLAYYARHFEDDKNGFPRGTVVKM